MTSALTMLAELSLVFSPRPSGAGIGARRHLRPPSSPERNPEGIAIRQEDRRRLRGQDFDFRARTPKRHGSCSTRRKADWVVNVQNSSQAC